MNIFDGTMPAKDIDGAVREKLAQSITHVGEVYASELEIDKNAIAELGQRIRTLRKPPSVFAHYFNMVLAAQNDQVDDMKAAWQAIDRASFDTTNFRVLPYTKQDLGDDYDLLPKLLFSEVGVSPIVPPNADEYAEFEQNLTHAFEIIKTLRPELHEEILALFHIICATSKIDDPTIQGFGSVTSLMVWGATFVNIDVHPTLLDVINFIVHEATHARLFGLSYDAPLVLNPLHENYNSPLRPDKRPMDGIYHATLVCARIVEFNKLLLNAGCPDGIPQQQLEDTIKGNTARFLDGYDVVQSHGKLSPLGASIIQQAYDVLAHEPA